MFCYHCFGIGIDCPNIRRGIHLGVPYTMEEYFQEAGRPGRDGLPAEAVVYYGRYDKSKAKRGLQDCMIKFVKSTSDCKRDIILLYFGYHAPKRSGGGHNCCDYNRIICMCELCKSSSNKNQATVSEDEEHTSTAVAMSTMSVSSVQRVLFPPRASLL